MIESITVKREEKLTTISEEMVDKIEKRQWGKQEEEVYTMLSHKGMCLVPLFATIKWTHFARSVWWKRSTLTYTRVRWKSHHWAWWIPSFVFLSVGTDQL